MFKFLILWEGFLLINQPGQAQQNNQNAQSLLGHIHFSADKMPNDWFTCEDSKDCGLVRYNCMAEALAANNNHLKNAQGVICKTELCSWTQCTKPPNDYYAACEKDQCVTKIGVSPDISGADPDPDGIKIKMNESSARKP